MQVDSERVRTQSICKKNDPQNHSHNNIKDKHNLVGTKIMQSQERKDKCQKIQKIYLQTDTTHRKAI